LELLLIGWATITVVYQLDGVSEQKNSSTFLLTLALGNVDTIIFCTVDIISLVIQAVGGGLASSANTLDGANNVGCP
jgi:hypothetical protein